MEATPKKVQVKKVPVDVAKYNSFCMLSHAEEETLAGGKALKPDLKAKLEELKKEVKNYSGKKAIKSASVFTGTNGVLKMVKDFPVPNELLKSLDKKHHENYVK